MTSFSDLLQQGAGHAWLFAPTAVLLGALHGLEPGHSKTMMAAFIIAIRGSVRQAVLLGLCATLSHTAIVWVIALGGMYLWRGVGAETLEPYLQLASAVIVMTLGAWTIWRTWREGRAHDHHDADHGHLDHDHHHHDHPHDHHHDHFDLDAEDAHARAHAEDIRRRFSGRQVTTGQIVVFGLTGGLIPCPGAITVLLLCVQLGAFALGAALVLCFSIGLALTLVVSGVLAALSVREVGKRWAGFGEVVRKAPYVSGVAILLIGLYLGVAGWTSLSHA